MTEGGEDDNAEISGILQKTFTFVAVVVFLIANSFIFYFRVLSDADISFFINLFPDGYSIGNPSEVCCMLC